MNAPNIDPITAVIAYLAAASSSEAPAEVRSFYAATARATLQRLDADVRELKGKLATIELELVRGSGRGLPAGKAGA